MNSKFYATLTAFRLNRNYRPDMKNIPYSAVTESNNSKLLAAVVAPRGAQAKLTSPTDIIMRPEEEPPNSTRSVSMTADSLSAAPQHRPSGSAHKQYPYRRPLDRRKALLFINAASFVSFVVQRTFISCLTIQGD